MGSVWLAHDRVLDRTVAIKRIGRAPGPEGDPDLRRAMREARLAATLSHSHVVAVFDLAVEDDQQWLVMEYVEGLTLAQLVKRDGPLTPDRAAGLLKQAADALAAAHHSGIVHRDVKPSNILVTGEDHVTLTDFGIARATGDDTMTQTGMVTGSPAYLAPEVASGRPATAASDVWSLGATLYFVLTGTTAYDAGGNIVATLYRIVHEDPPRPEEAGWLAALLEHTMAVDPGDRWSMSAVQAFLGSSGSTQTAVRPGRPPATSEDSATGTQELTGIRSSGSSTRSRSHARSTPWFTRPIAAVIAVAVVLVSVVAWVLLGGEKEQASPDPGRDGESSSVESESSTQGPTAEGMQEFVTTYLDTVTQDPADAWTMLTPEFQAESGPFQKYDKAWQKRPSADVSNIEADPDSLTVSYDVTYFDKNGKEVLEDRPTLTLTFQDGEYLIDAEA
jgi:serine/threonine protein kinase